VRVIFSAVLAALFIVAAPAPRASDAATRHAGTAGQAADGGDEIRFDVYRNGTRVGFHRVRFQAGDGGLTVDAQFEIQVTFLGITVYRYRYDSQALWTDGGLSAIRTTVDDDGAFLEVQARRIGARFYIAAGDAAYETAAPLFPTNHWNAGVLGQDRVLNTLTGQVNKVRIEARGPARVETERGPVAATHYAYTGDLTTDVWYDAAGRWVKMRFQGRDGSLIDYVCRQCQGGPGKRASG
jgi:hypothetical protein